MGVYGSGFWVLRLGFRGLVFGIRVSSFGFRVSGFGFRVSGLGFRVYGESAAGAVGGGVGRGTVPCVLAVGGSGSAWGSASQSVLVSG